MKKQIISGELWSRAVHFGVQKLMACTVKVQVPEHFVPYLSAIYPNALKAVRRMLKRRHESSSKFYKEVPCVVAKSLIAKYQKNQNCKSVSNLVIPVCGDQGRQIKRDFLGIRVRGVLGQNILLVKFPREVIGFVRSAEFYPRGGKWYATICYNTPAEPDITPAGIVGIDRNSVGNVAVMADLQTGKVFKMGYCPARTKAVMRGRRKNLQKAGKTRLLNKLRRKQRRRMAHENHRVAKSVVDYAARHRRTVAIENLAGVRASESKICRYSNKNQWACAQLEVMLRYKCALRGVPIISVSPAYTSQDCSRCGSRHKPTGKRFSCGSCGHNDHRDANAAFNVARIGWSGLGLSVSRSGNTGEALPETAS